MIHLGIKIFLCTCNGQIEVPPHPDFGEDTELVVREEACVPEAVAEIRESASKGSVVFAGCSPMIAERFFGTIPIEYVNTREQVAYAGHPVEKSQDLIRGAVEKARVSLTPELKEIPVAEKAALVIGGGLAGMEAASCIASAGYEVTLIEKGPVLGGIVAKLDRLYPEGTPGSHTVYHYANRVLANQKITVHTNAELDSMAGKVGNYRAQVNVSTSCVGECDACGKCAEVCPITVDDYGLERKAIFYGGLGSYVIDAAACNQCGECAKVCDQIIIGGMETKEVGAGAVVVSTGLKPYDATAIKEYGYGVYPGVMNAIEFERRVTAGLIKPEKVAIVACAGSRDRNYLEYCSQVCCLICLKEAKLIKDLYPETKVWVHYIDMRSYGEFEHFYTAVREKAGVEFINGRPSQVLSRNGKLVVRSEDILLGRSVEMEVDAVVLSVGFVPETELLAKLGIAADERSGFPTYVSDSSLFPDSNPKGIILCGGAAYPKPAVEAVREARYAANTALAVLASPAVQVEHAVPRIDSDICSSLHCQLCVSSCPYGAITLEDEKITVHEELCMGCGICSGTCGVSANPLEGQSEREILAAISGAVREGDVLALLCRWSAYPAADLAGFKREEYPPNTKIMRIPCTGRVTSSMIEHALAQGAKGVLVAGCYPDACHYCVGNFKAKARLLLLEKYLDQMNLPGALRLEWIGTKESSKLVGILQEMA